MAEFIACIWPVVPPGETESQRRKQRAARGMRLALTAMLGVVVVATIAADYPDFSVEKALALAGAGLVYLVWSLAGTHRVLQSLLWHRGIAPAPAVMPRFTVKRAFFLVVQLGLAALLYHLGSHERTAPLLWLVLLPPVALSVVLLPRVGVVMVAALSSFILLTNVVRRQGWELAPTALLLHSCAVMFTLVFTHLAAASERARSEVERLLGELEEASSKLREYAIQAEELAAMRERNRLAREIHDNLGHYLTVVNVQLEAARALGDRQPDAAWAAVTKAQQLTREGLDEIRRSVAALRASPLDNQSLTGALRGLVEASHAAGLTAELRVLGAERTLAPAAALTLYRAGQEGLTNIRKHSGANHARLTLDFQTPGRVRLVIRDHGAGAAEGAAATTGFGLLGLRERAQLLGGAVQVRTAPGAGFTLEVEVPE